MFGNPDKFLKIATGIGILAAGAGIGYHFGVYVPKIEQARIAQAEQSQKNKENQFALQRKEARENYSICISAAEDLYDREWSDNCKLNSIGNKNSTCSLPENVATNVNDRLQERKSRCLEIFKAEID